MCWNRISAACPGSWTPIDCFSDSLDNRAPFTKYVEHVLAVVRVWPNASENMIRPRVYLAHDRDLMILFLRCLYNTDGIYPVVFAGLGRESLLQNIFAISPYHQRPAVDRDLSRISRVAPGIRYRIVWWCTINGPCRNLAFDVLSKIATSDV